jgi:hypothetical protein
MSICRSPKRIWLLFFVCLMVCVYVSQKSAVGSLTGQRTLSEYTVVSLWIMAACFYISRNIRCFHDFIGEARSDVTVLTISHITLHLLLCTPANGVFALVRGMGSTFQVDLFWLYFTMASVSSPVMSLAVICHGLSKESMERSGLMLLLCCVVMEVLLVLWNMDFVYWYFLAGV